MDSSDLPFGRRRAAAFFTSVLGLAPGGVYIADGLLSPLVSSYLTLSSLPARPAVYFLLHLPWSHLHRALPGTLLCGARTFLRQPALPAIIWLSSLVSIPQKACEINVNFHFFRHYPLRSSFQTRNYFPYLARCSHQSEGGAAP